MFTGPTAGTLILLTNLYKNRKEVLRTKISEIARKNIVPELSVEVQEVMMIVIFLSLCISFALVSFTVTLNENIKIKGCYIKIAKRTSPLYNPPVYFF